MNLDFNILLLFENFNSKFSTIKADIDIMLQLSITEWLNPDVTIWNLKSSVHNGRVVTMKRTVF
jgi:hypothetical protein